MLSDFLKDHITSQANYVKYGYGQVEPNHLSAQRTAQVYAQLPAKSDINVLEQGQFVKYDYAAGVCDFTGAGEWMLVFNEIKLYRENQLDCEFALIKDNYEARVYSPFGGNGFDTNWDAQSRYYNGKDSDGHTSITLNGKTYNYDDVTAAPDMYELHYNPDPYHIESQYKEAMMPTGTKMVPRVFKTNVGDIMTTNTINVTASGANGAVDYENDLKVGAILTPDASNGILRPVVTSGDSADAADCMKWQVATVYTMPDHQPGVRIIRIQ